MTSDSLPNLTIGRWAALKALKEQPVLLRRPFIAREVKIQIRNGKRKPASGATMHATRQRGIFKQVSLPRPLPERLEVV